jgi:hypothetical protein
VGCWKFWTKRWGRIILGFGFSRVESSGGKVGLGLPISRVAGAAVWVVSDDPPPETRDFSRNITGSRHHVKSVVEDDGRMGC